jgi:hypothetical protein
MRLHDNEESALFREEITENRMKHINTLCGQNAEFLMLKGGGIYSYHFVSEGLRETRHGQLKCLSLKKEEKGENRNLLE